MTLAFNTPWKIWIEVYRFWTYPSARLLFALNGIRWGRHWRIHGVPIIQKHRNSEMKFGDGLGLRSFVRSNPLGPNHPVILCTWKSGAVLEIGENFAMTGGVLCAAQCISIGNHVIVGANTTIIDTDFHPLNYHERVIHPNDGKVATVVIENNVFIGMNCLILKGVRLGQESVVGAGSVVTQDVPAGAIAAGNPARVLRMQ